MLSSSRSHLCLAVLSLIALGLTACNAQRSPAQTIEAYLQARTASNIEEVVALSCARWEIAATTEADAASSMNGRLEGMACHEQTNDGRTAVVACTGKLVTTYQGEQREWPLDERLFEAVLEDGEWRMCGYR